MSPGFPRIRRRLAGLGIPLFQWTPRVRNVVEYEQCLSLVSWLIDNGRADILQGLMARTISAQDLLTAGRESRLGLLRYKSTNDRPEPDLYFIHNPKAMLVKIGVSRNVSQRRVDLEHMAGMPLVTLMVVPGGAPYERQLHRAFAPIRRRGEWFHASFELMRVIEEPDRLRRVLAGEVGSIG